MIVNATMNALWAQYAISKGNATRPCVMIKIVQRRGVVKTIDALGEQIVISRIAHHPTSATTTCASKTKRRKSAKFMVIVKPLTNALSSMVGALV